MEAIRSRLIHPAIYLSQPSFLGRSTKACGQSLPGVILIYSYPLLLVLAIYLLSVRWTATPSPSIDHLPVKGIDIQRRTLKKASLCARTRKVVSRGTLTAKHGIIMPRGQHVPHILKPAPSQRAKEALNTRREHSPHAFTSLCDRLLLTHQIWEQVQEIKTLRSTVAEKDQSISRITFSAFADRLLLHNRIWQQDRQIAELRATCERLKKTQESMITRSAEKMMVDVRKEGLVEDFVKDLIAEVEASKREIMAVRESHEKEIEEVNGEWLKDYRDLAREADRLRLGQQARLAEQELASETEESLMGSLKSVQRKAKILEEQVDAYEAARSWSSSDASSVYSTAPCSICSTPSFSMSTFRRRMSYELDDDDTLADFSIASTNASKTDFGSLSKDCASSSIVLSRIPGTCHHNQVFFAPASPIRDAHLDHKNYVSPSRGRCSPSHLVHTRTRRPTLLPLKLSMSMWPQKKKDHMSPTSASVRKGLNPASRSRSRRRVKLAIWRP